MRLNKISLSDEVIENKKFSKCVYSKKRLSNYHLSKHQNAFISINESLLVDESLSETNSKLPLLGLPFSCKDNINTVDFFTTGGTPGLSNFLPKNDAGIVAQIKSLGGRLVGKNNMHELSFGVTSKNSTWGTVLNPLSEEHIAGGSSGGSAAAVAAGVVAFSIGTDTGGSVRIPSAACGVTGFRPTTGRYFNDGVIPVSHTKDTTGIIAPTVEDVAWIDGILTDDISRRTKKNLCIGLPKGFRWEELDDRIKSACETVVDRLTDSGVRIVPIDDIKWSEMNSDIQFDIPFYEFFIDFPRFMLEQGLGDKIDHVFSQISDPNIKEILKSQKKSVTFSHEDYISRLEVMSQIRKRWHQAFNENEIDAVIYPTIAIDTPLQNNSKARESFSKLVRNTDLASTIGAPSITFPIARSGELPIGLSLDGLPDHDSELLSAAVFISDLLN